MSNSERVISLDPGGRTGWATATMSLDSFVLTGSGVYRQDTMARKLALAQRVVYFPDNAPAVFENFPPRTSYDVIVAESWRPRQKNGSMKWIEGDPLLSAQHLGQIRFIADLSGAKYVEYAPAQKEKVWVPSMPPKLKALDEFSSEQHDKDARMHLWGYFFENWFSGEGDPEEYVDA